MAAVRENEEERIRKLEELTPELPEDFEDWCAKKLWNPEIYYKRKGNNTECICGKCAEKCDRVRKTGGNLWELSVE